MNLSIDPDEDFIRDYHPVSAMAAFPKTTHWKLNCVVLIWVDLGEHRADWSGVSVATINFLKLSLNTALKQ